MSIEHHEDKDAATVVSVARHLRSERSLTAIVAQNLELGTLEGVTLFIEKYASTRYVFFFSARDSFLGRRFEFKSYRPIFRHFSTMEKFQPPSSDGWYEVITYNHLFPHIDIWVIVFETPKDAFIVREKGRFELIYIP